MSAPQYVLRELAESDQTESFTCGNEALDRWLRETAARAHRAGSVRVRLLWERDSERLVGYSAICPTEIRRADLPLSSRVRGGASTVSGFMLAKLAVAADAQGQGLGRDLLVDALERICAAAASVGGRIVVVDPIDSAATSFYGKYGFTAITDHTRMFLLVQDARHSLGLE